MKNILLRLVLGCNIMSIIIMWAVASCGWVSPERLSWSGIACMALPVFMVINALFIPFWLVVHARYTPVPIAGLLCCWGSVQSYCPVFGNGSGDAGHELKIVSFNTEYWGNCADDDDGRNQVIRWCIDQDADIILVQEADFGQRYYDEWKRAGYTLLHPKGMIGTEAIATRLPVVDYCDVRLPSLAQNNAVKARLLWNGDTITAFSVHLESFHLNDTDRDEYVNVMRNPTDDGTKARSSALVKKIRPRLAMHGPQADTLLRHVEADISAGRHVIIGGDFNDVPNSYACTRMRLLMTDCFRESGRGVGFTFSENMMYFRIDHIYCSPSLKPLKTWVDKSITNSDHYPVVSVFRAEN